MAKDISQLPLEFRKFKAEVELFLKELLPETAETAVRSIVASSPIDTGTYIDSHRIAFNGIDTSFANHFVSRDAASATSLRRTVLSKLLSKLGAINDSVHSVTISNHCGHDLQVEVMGWKRTPPKAVYSQALLTVTAFLEAKSAMFNSKRF